VKLPGTWLRDARRQLARLPSLRMARVPDAPAQPVRDPWLGGLERGAALMRGEIALDGGAAPLRPGSFGPSTLNPLLRATVHGFTWLRDLRALGTDAARMRARALVSDWIAEPAPDPIAERPDVIGARVTAWLGQYDFFAASADDGFRQRLMARLVADARMLAAALPAEELDARAITAVKGVIAAAVALPEHTAFLARGLRVLPQELNRQILPDGCHCERSPSQQLAVLMDLVEIRTLLQAAGAPAPEALVRAIERMGPALRLMRHGDGGLALFNGTREDSNARIEAVLSQAGRAGRMPSQLPEGGFHRLQAGRTVLIMDCGPPAAAKLDRLAHAGTLGFELSVGRERLIVNCGALPGAGPDWHDATRASAAHSTLVIAETNSSDLRPAGLGSRRPTAVEVSRQEASGAHWLHASHDGWRIPFGAIHRRRVYITESGEEIRGEDTVEAAQPQPFIVRFHLHPTVKTSLQQDGEAVLLRLPSGGFWRLRADGARVSLDRSIYLGGEVPRETEQIVLTGSQDGPQQVLWALLRLG
jgi:uncharacterized heparinase superfamily protein